MRGYLHRRWAWLSSVPRDLLLIAAVSITWGFWLAHVYGVYMERAKWEAYRSEMIRQMCIPPPKQWKEEV